MQTDELVREGTSTRQDVTGKWHSVRSAPCEECGCLYDYSLDVPGVIWEAGANVDDRCLNDACECHILPVEGLVFRFHTDATV